MATPVQFNRGELEAPLDRSLSNPPERAKAAARPFDTDVTIESSADRWMLRIPPRGLRNRSAAVNLGVAVMLLATGLVTGVVTGLWRGGEVSPLIAGLLTGPLIALFALRSMAIARTRTALIIDGPTATVVRTLGPLTRTKHLQTSGLRAGWDYAAVVDANKRIWDDRHLLLEDGRKSVKLLAEVGALEQDWILNELTGWLAERHGAASDGERQQDHVDVPAPSGTRVRLSIDGERLSLHIPSQPLPSALWHAVPVVLLLLGPGGFATCFPAAARGGTTLLGVPLLAFGAFVLAWIYRTELTELQLELDGPQGTLNLRAPFLSRCVALRTGQLRVRQVYNLSRDDDNRYSVSGTSVVLDHGSRSYRFGTYLTRVEQDWIVASLSTWLRERGWHAPPSHDR